MRVYVVRHGKAEQSSPSGRDEDRPLRPRGERQAEWLGAAIARSERRDGRDNPLLLSSDLVRAIETARRVHAGTGGELRVAPPLRTGFDPLAALALLDAELRCAVPARGSAARAVILVGHNPQLEGLVALLAEGSPGAEAPLRTGEGVVLDLFADDRPLRARLRARLRLDEDD